MTTEAPAGLWSAGASPRLAAGTEHHAPEVTRVILPSSRRRSPTRHAARLRFSRAVGIDGARAALGQRSLDTTLLYGASGDAELAIDAARKVG